MSNPDDEGSIYLNKDGKDVRFFIAGTKPDGSIEWEDVTEAAVGGREAQEKAFAHRGTVYGKLEAENETTKMIVITSDKGAHEKISTAFKDAASIAQEWMLPPGYFDRPRDDAGAQPVGAGYLPVVAILTISVWNAS